MKMQDRTMSQLLRRCLFAMMAVALLMGLSRPASLLAQDADATEVPDKKDVAYISYFVGPGRRLIDDRYFRDRNFRNTQRFLIEGICRGGKPYEENKQAFADYFNKYYFPLLTHPGQWSADANTDFNWFHSSVDIRQDLKKRNFGAIKDDPKGQEVRDALNVLTLKFMATIVNPKYNFHPSVKYNAMLIVGELDTRGPQTFGDARPAEPWNKSLEFMLDELVNPAQIDAVRVACLIGIRRHAELNKYQPANRQLTEAALRILIDRVGKVASARTPPISRSQEGHAWMRRLAIETLGELETAGPGAAVTTVLDSIVTDTKAPRQLRGAAAAALGKIRNPLAPDADPAKTAKAMGRIGVESLLGEIEAIDPYLNQLTVKAERAFAGGGRGEVIRGPRPDILDLAGSTSDDEETIELPMDPHVERLQRQLQLDFRQLKMGLTGDNGKGGLASAAKAAPQKELITDIAAAVDEVLATLAEAPRESPELFRDLAIFRDKLAQSGAKLDNLVATTTDASGPTADGPSPDGPRPDGPGVGPSPEGPTTAPSPDGPTLDGPPAAAADEPPLAP